MFLNDIILNKMYILNTVQGNQLCSSFNSSELGIIKSKLMSNTLAKKSNHH